MSDNHIGPCEKYCAVVDECDARGAEILRLRTENEKLRAALKPFADMAQYCDNMQISENQCLFVEDLRAAAAALKETGDD